MRKYFILLVGVLALITGPSLAQPVSSDSKFPLFATIPAAQHHCPFDFVVWLNIKTDTYTMNGPPAGQSKDDGAYMCQRDADQMDYRFSETGQ